MVTTLNDIPGHLRGPEQPEWTPQRGFVRGGICAVGTVIIVGSLLCPVAYWFPPLVSHWLLNAVWGFLVAWVLFAVVHRAAGTAGAPCTVMAVVGAGILIVAKHWAVLIRLAELNGTGASAWSLFDLSRLVLHNATAWGGIAGAAYMCKDGDSILNDVAEMLMGNMFTGRR